ncbi:MAG: hypothetical protein JST92_00210 [Deltaproteobacteria bacterium]|nr:hypothetical protein [Deltaproteobacteria bacterium]
MAANRQVMVFPFTVPIDGAGNMRDAAQGVFARSLARALAERLSEGNLTAQAATLTAHGSPERPSDKPEEHGWVVATQPWTLDEALTVQLPEGTEILLHGGAELTDRVRMRLLLVDQPKKTVTLDHVVLRPRSELFSALDEAASAVAHALGEKLPKPKWPTDDVEAFVAYLRGRDMSAAIEAGVHVSEPARSFEGYLEAARRDPSFEDAQERLLTMALDFALGGQGPREVARQSCEKLLVQDPSAYKAHAVLAEIDLVEGAIDSSIDHLKALLALKDDWWPAFERMGAALLRKGQTLEALMWFDKALAEKSNEADALFGRGVCLAEQGRLEEALASWSAIERQGDVGERSLPLHQNMARALDKLGRTREAARHRAIIRELSGEPKYGLAWLKDTVKSLFSK